MKRERIEAESKFKGRDFQFISEWTIKVIIIYWTVELIRFSIVDNFAKKIFPPNAEIILFLKNGHFPASFSLFSSFQYNKWSIKFFADDWIGTVDPWNKKQLLY